ncbi:NPC intracellular cholesterol transporter 2 homolog a-like [Hetaerina americana]|uniref:NPC intracellular cholesterol transporter 2 homolog a-like n=1 Tax=Hetaerina americana TaxID=62018 RepID=UPI003A7F2B12
MYNQAVALFTVLAVAHGTDYHECEKPASELTVQVRVKVLHFWVDYPIGYDDACPYLRAGKCPLSPGDSATYEFYIPVRSHYPKISIQVELSLMNENGDSLSCFKIAGQVVD